MITVAEAGKLGAIHIVHPGVLSLYLAVPLDRGELRGLSARADDLIAAAGADAGAHAAEEDRNSVRERLQISGSDWRGRTVAIFACAEVGLFEVFPLPCLLPDRAVLGIRPHIRPLLVAAQRHDEGVLTPGGLAATGLRACLAAVNACAVQTLIVPDDGLIPGYECGRCGALSLDADGCCDWGTAALPVPDLIEEMVARTLEDGGQVCPVHDAPSRIAARLHFPIAR